MGVIWAWFESDHTCNPPFKNAAYAHVRILFFSLLATPVAPLILLINATSPSSFHIQWIFPGTHSFISNYTIEVQSAQAPPESAWIPLHVRSASAVTTANISSPILEPFTEYRVRVVAIYRDGRQIPSEVEVVRMESNTPLDPPSNIKAVTSNKTALNVTWNVSDISEHSRAAHVYCSITVQPLLFK